MIKSIITISAGLRGFLFGCYIQPGCDSPTDWGRCDILYVTRSVPASCSRPIQFS